MCEFATIATGIGLALSAAGTAYGVSQQSAAAKAQSQANQANITASNNAFWARNQNARQELVEEGQTQNKALAAQEQAFQTQREGQAKALSQRDQVVQQENQSAEDVRSAADRTQSQLLAQTSGPALAEAQATEAATRQQAFAPIAQSVQTTTPFAAGTSGDTTKQAFASRLAEAADAVRSYGKKVAQVASYTAPLNTVQNAATEANTGLMPTAVANQLLQGGQGIRLLPSQSAYSIAGSEGEQTQGAIQAGLQGDLNVLKNRYQGQESVIGLGLNNQTTINNNAATAAESDAKVGQSIGGLISSVGSLAAYGGQRFGQPAGAGASADALLGAPPGMNTGLIQGRTAGAFSGIR